MALKGCAMIRPARLLLRLRHRALRLYELMLYLTLVAMAVAMGLPASPADRQDEPVQCGNIQSSAVVITR